MADVYKRQGRGDRRALADVGLVAGGAGVAEGVLVGDGVGGHGDRVFVLRRVEVADVVAAGGAVRFALDQAQSGDVAFGARGADVYPSLIHIYSFGARSCNESVRAWASSSFLNCSGR